MLTLLYNDHGGCCMMSVDNVIAKKYPPILAMSSLSVSLCHTIPPCAALGMPYDHSILYKKCFIWNRMDHCLLRLLT